MKRVALILIWLLLGLPAAAQVEIRGLVVAPSGGMANGGVVLKSLISTRAPGEIREVVAGKGGVFARIDDHYKRLTFRNGALAFEDSPQLHPDLFIISVAKADLDGDGVEDHVYYSSGTDREKGVTVITRGESGKWQDVHLPGYGRQNILTVLDLARSGTPQIVAIGANNHCLHVIQYRDKQLKEIGTLSCGEYVVGGFAVGDVDGDGREDLVVARKPDRIEIFLR